MTDEAPSSSVKLNAPGDFYVADVGCLACMSPHEAAPDLMGFDEKQNQCFVKRQPTTPTELTKMINAVRASCLACVRYAGTDKSILQRLCEIGSIGECDNPPFPGPEPKTRNHCDFRLARTGAESVKSTLETIKAGLRQRPLDPSELRKTRNGYCFAYVWHEIAVPGIEVTLEKLDPSGVEYHIYLTGEVPESIRNFAVEINELIKDRLRASQVQWRTPEERSEGNEGKEFPI